LLFHAFIFLIPRIVLLKKAPRRGTSALLY
jgi:hypothetical protein